MGRLLLIRHAQASFLERNYDKLSALGETQALRLGRHWARQKLVFDGVCSGLRARHKETEQIVAAAYHDAGIPFPETVVIPEFDEYQAEAVLKQGLPRLIESNSAIRELHRAFQDSTNPERRLANFEKMFEMLITRWVDGEFVLPAVESWPEFCARATAVYPNLCPRVAAENIWQFSVRLGSSEWPCGALCTSHRKTRFEQPGWSAIIPSASSCFPILMTALLLRPCKLSS
jgi:broad specificity phosphatase PhoE